MKKIVRPWKIGDVSRSIKVRNENLAIQYLAAEEMFENDISLLRCQSKHSRNHSKSGTGHSGESFSGGFF